MRSRLILSLLLVAVFYMHGTAYAVEPTDFADKTYFTTDRYDRIHFADDGSFAQQLEDDWHDIQAGEIIQGQWFIHDENNMLCMQYYDFSADSASYCFTISSRNGKTYADINGKHVFVWDNIREGNWLLTSKGLNDVKNAGFQETNINEEEIKNYFIGKIFKDGDILTYTQDDFSGLAYNAQTETMTPFTAEFNKGAIVFRLETPEPIVSNRLWTLGDEFMEDKPHQIYFYQSKTLVIPESDDVFTLTPFEQSPDKDIFLPYLNLSETTKID